ncbi:hypothetical protein [Kitasatospora azatica]|uniref:hypothetical protein n=1 Tax=Kitasatospora azatica TaxID=58347 RepID=UPI0005609B22|nr:hypothetical protein [Kitasatospora azatica]
MTDSQPTPRERLEVVIRTDRCDMPVWTLTDVQEPIDALLADRRNQALTEAAELLRTTRGALNGAEWPDHAAGLLLAARTTTAQEQ